MNSPGWNPGYRIIIICNPGGVEPLPMPGARPLTRRINPARVARQKPRAYLLRRSGSPGFEVEEVRSGGVEKVYSFPPRRTGMGLFVFAPRDQPRQGCLSIAPGFSHGVSFD